MRCWPTRQSGTQTDRLPGQRRPRSDDDFDPQDLIDLLVVPPADIAPLLMDLNSLLLNDSSTSALVVAAWTHGELMRIQPFGTRDGLVARAAERLVLRSRGFDPRGLIVTAGRASYQEQLQGFATGDLAAMADWVEHCARAVRTGAATIEVVCNQLAE